jgi:hypothetical protein
LSGGGRGRNGAGWRPAGQFSFPAVSVFRPCLFSTTWPGLILALFSQPANFFNNFPALFLGLFGFVFQCLSFIIINFPALFFKKRVFLSHTI